MKKKSKEKIAITLFLIITIIAKILLIKVQPVRYLPTNKYDDGLMVNMANNLLMVRRVQLLNISKRNIHTTVYSNYKNNWNSIFNRTRLIL